MISDWIMRLLPRKRLVAEHFSLRALEQINPALVSQFIWRANPMSDLVTPWLHWGCGERFFDGFVNVDFRPSDPRILDWDLLDLWPVEEWQARFAGSYSEDVLEHFFIGEQAYLLCSLNCLLQPEGICRVLMPSYARLIEYVNVRDARPGGFLHDTFGVTTPVDAINMGLRFSGHRWLHDQDSFTHLARTCGFDTNPTSCGESIIPEFSHRNLRSEADTASFANDLRKRDTLRRMKFMPTEVRGAVEIDALAPECRFYLATQEDTEVVYRLGQPMAVETMACLNVRSANVSSFRDHYYKQISFSDGAQRSEWRLDETVKSKLSMNLMTRDQIRLATRQQPNIMEIKFKPAKKGEYFTLGEVEVFVSV